MEMQSLEIRVEPLMPKAHLLDALLEEHWEESAKNKHLMVLKPDRAVYQSLEDRGSLLALFAYSGEDIVGYSINFSHPHLHYSDLTVTYNDVIYIHPDYRKSRLGLTIIKATELEAKKRGSQLMLWHAKENTALSAILPRMGCKVQEIMFSKEL